jgi:hypothetical protein
MIVSKYQSALHTVVTFPRCFGCAISVISDGHVPLLMWLPAPMEKRPARYISALNRSYTLYGLGVHYVLA